VEPNALVIAFNGDVDLEHSPKAREILLKGIEHKKAIFVDLSGVTYIDSSGVASLVEAYQRAKGQGTDFALVSVNPAALRVFQLARLDKVFVIHESLPEGLAGGA
jgi:anti-sigma B factor antagonist